MNKKIAKLAQVINIPYDEFNSKWDNKRISPLIEKEVFGGSYTRGKDWELKRLGFDIEEDLYSQAYIIWSVVVRKQTSVLQFQSETAIDKKTIKKLVKMYNDIKVEEEEEKVVKVRGKNKLKKNFSGEDFIKSLNRY